jgi:hypothetical protein
MTNCAEADLDAAQDPTVETTDSMLSSQQIAKGGNSALSLRYTDAMIE